MFNRIVLALVAIVISVAVSNAKEGKKQEECPTLNRSEIENLIHQAPSCQRAISLFEICAFGSSAPTAAAIAICGGNRKMRGGFSE